MSITRTTLTDDSGSGTDGTVLNNAWLQTVYDALDGRWSSIAITSTGTVNDLSITSTQEADLLVCSNASDLTITGIVAPASPSKPGKMITIVSTGAGKVILAHNNSSSTAANRLLNFATSAGTPLAAGSGVACYIYDNATSRWRLIVHDQGADITATFAAGDYTASGAGTWTVGSGDVTTAAYRLVGRHLHLVYFIQTTTVVRSGGDPIYLRIGNGAWGSFTAARTTLNPCVISDAGAANAIGFGQINTGISTTHVLVSSVTSAQWANATNTTLVAGEIEFAVT